MDYNKINLSKIKFDVVQEPPHISIKYDNKDFVISTPVMSVPFGIDEAYDRYYMKLQFENKNDYGDVQFFYDIMKGIETSIKNYASEIFGEQFEVSSEFNHRTGHDPTINTKLVSYKTRIKTKIYSKQGSLMNYWQIEPNTNVKCKLSLNGIWPKNNKFYYKWNVEEIRIQE